jgi:hypothetical protein
VKVFVGNVTGDVIVYDASVACVGAVGDKDDKRVEVDVRRCCVTAFAALEVVGADAVRVGLTMLDFET